MSDAKDIASLRSLAKYRLRAKKRELEIAAHAEVATHATWQRAKRRVRKLEAEALEIEREVWGLPREVTDDSPEMAKDNDKEMS